MNAKVIETDAVIVGAGPCGLFQVFELGLQGIRAHVVDSMRVVGGQCAELYPDKPIYDIPAIPVCTGDELTQDLLKQIEPFSPGMHFGEEVTVVRPNDDGTFYVETRGGKEFEAKAIVISLWDWKLLQAETRRYMRNCLHKRAQHLYGNFHKEYCVLFFLTGPMMYATADTASKLATKHMSCR